MQIHFEIKGLPKMYNQMKNMHWAAKSTHNNKWKKLVWATLFAAKKIPEKPIIKAKLKMVRCSSASPDFDNLAQSFKPIIDALVEIGVISNDTMEVIGKSEYEWQKAKSTEGKIIVTVWYES